MKKFEMKPRERVIAALRGESFDVFPAICPTSVAISDSMKKLKAFFPSAHTKADDIATLAGAAHDLYSFDSVMPYFSVHIESSALGCEMDWGDINNVPSVIKKPLEKKGDLHIPSNITKKKQMQSIIKAISLLKKRYKNDIAIIGKVVGPWTIAYNIYGAENLILDTILEPEETKAFINELTHISIDFAKAQYEAGADIITWAEHVTSDLISAKIYSEFVLPIHQKSAATLQQYGQSILHICGNVMDRLDEIAKSSFKTFHIDSRNDIKKVSEFFGDSPKLCGAINNPVTLLQGTPKDIALLVESNIRDGIRLIASECAVPCNVPAANLKAIVDTAHRIPFR